MKESGDSGKYYASNIISENGTWCDDCTINICEAKAQTLSLFQTDDELRGCTEAQYKKKKAYKTTLVESKNRKTELEMGNIVPL